ncbi:hypothetical protein EC957_008872 [Mortierella hygrophila]|uniref:Uncharacterized protein n=1 Tax=Mortierella hygrophila TaxID=979708 RepID=A0A9P6JXF6_9FUNG|nr:hypothetical protein EC957_008872 [Mortierella hygrophila]
MVAILIKSYKHDNTHHHHHYHTQQQQQQEQEYRKHLRQADNDHRSREAILRHLQPYIDTERLRQHQQQVRQLQQQNRLQQQLLLQQEKRLAKELEWLQKHQQKQAAGASVGLSVQEIWDHIPSTKNHIQPNERHQRRQQPQPHQQQTQQQPEMDERQHREKQELWELYKLRRQQEQEIVKRRQQLQQQQELEQALLSNKLLQQPSAKKDENWVQSTIDIDNKQNGIEDSDDDEEVDFEGEDHPGQYYNQQDQYDWRGLCRLNKVYVPLPRRKRGRKGRGDFFEDDYHAGFNKIEIHALSSAGKAAYEAQRQNRQHHDASRPRAVIVQEELE